MAEDKKRKSKGTSTPEQAFSNLADVILEILNEQNPEDLEVFERYTHVLKSKIQTRSNFSECLWKGYEILCEHLKNK